MAADLGWGVIQAQGCQAASFTKDGATSAGPTPRGGVKGPLRAERGVHGVRGLQGVQGGRAGRLPSTRHEEEPASRGSEGGWPGTWGQLGEGDSREAFKTSLGDDFCLGRLLLQTGDALRSGVAHCVPPSCPLSIAWHLGNLCFRMTGSACFYPLGC